MTPYIILVAGIPASGKTTYARHISEKLRIPLICKDAIKENLYDVLHWDTSTRDNSQRYGIASYKVFFHIIESLMQANVSLVAESNFTTESAEILLPMIEKYAFRALTVMMDADLDVLSIRFKDREKTSERHPGLKMPATFKFNGFNSEGIARFKDFNVGDRIVVDTTDFTVFDCAKIDNDIANFISGKMVREVV